MARIHVFTKLDKCSLTFANVLMCSQERPQLRSALMLYHIKYSVYEMALSHNKSNWV